MTTNWFGARYNAFEGLVGAVSFGSVEDDSKSPITGYRMSNRGYTDAGMSGFELQAKLKAKRCRIPIIFITAHGDAKMRSQAMRDGAVKLAKPFDNTVS